MMMLVTTTTMTPRMMKRIPETYARKQNLIIAHGPVSCKMPSDTSMNARMPVYCVVMVVAPLSHARMYLSTNPPFVRNARCNVPI